MNNKGDLISREALKKTIDEVHQKDLKINPMWGSIGLNTLNRLINNAPTVEPCYQTTSCLDCKNYDKETHNCPRYCEVIKEAIKSRPQGEWLVVGHDDTTYWYRCSICEHEEHDNFTKHYHYCPNCGAKMKGGAE